MSKQNKDRVIGSFQGIDVLANENGQTYMELPGFGTFWLGVEDDAAEELAGLKAALANSKRTRAEVDAEIVQVLRESVTKLRDLCAEPTI